jgi:hypothetical protein
MNKIRLALGAVIAITATLALTTAAMSVIQQAMAVSNSSSVGNPTQVPLSSHRPCPNKTNSTSSNSSSGTASNSTNSTTSNSSHIVKSDLLFSGNNIVKIAANNPTQEPISSHGPCGGGVIIGSGPVSSPT